MRQRRIGEFDLIRRLRNATPIPRALRNAVLHIARILGKFISKCRKILTGLCPIKYLLSLGTFLSRV